MIHYILCSAYFPKARLLSWFHKYQSYIRWIRKANFLFPDFFSSPTYARKRTWNRVRSKGRYWWIGSLQFEIYKLVWCFKCSHLETDCNLNFCQHIQTPQEKESRASCLIWNILITCHPLWLMMSKNTHTIHLIIAWKHLNNGVRVYFQVICLTSLSLCLANLSFSSNFLFRSALYSYYNRSQICCFIQKYTKNCQI